MQRFTDMLRRIPAIGWFIALFFLMCCAYEVGRVLHLRPQPHHLWRQADCISLAWNYYDTTWNLFEPAVFHQFSDGGASGRTAGEFPLLYWIVGMIWRVTGPSELVYRLLVLLIHFAGSLALFDTVRRLTRDGFLATLAPLLLFTSPAVVYFSVSFLTDVPALDMALIGCWFTVRYAQDRQRRHWAWAVLFFTIGILLKVTAGISYLAICSVLAAETLIPAARRNGRAWFIDRRHAWICVAAGFAAILAWYVYADRYNAEHGGKYTFNNIWPIWHMSPEAVKWAWEVASDVVVFQVFDTTVWAAVGIGALVLLFNLRVLPWRAGMGLVLMVLGTCTYLILWFNCLQDGHDYYFLNPSITPMAVLVAGFWLLKDRYPEIVHARWMRMTLFALLGYNTLYAANNMHMRYDNSSQLGKRILWPVYHEAEIGYFNGLGWWGMDDLVNIGPELRRMGVRPEDKVYYPDDRAINSALVLMGQRGWTSYDKPDLPQDTLIERMKRNGLRYLVLSDAKWFSDTIMGRYMDHPVGNVGRTWVFDLRSDPEARQRTTILDASERSVHVRARLDTTSTDGTAWLFQGTEFPLELLDLPIRPAGMELSSLRISGAFSWATDTSASCVLYVAENANGEQVFMDKSGLVPGRFERRVLFKREGQARSCMAYVHNPHKLPFRIRDLQVVVHWSLAGTSEDSGEGTPN